MNVEELYRPPHCIKPGVFLHDGGTNGPYIITLTPVDTLHLVSLKNGRSVSHLRMADPYSVTYAEAKTLLVDPQCWHIVERWDELKEYMI